MKLSAATILSFVLTASPGLGADLVIPAEDCSHSLLSAATVEECEKQCDPGFQRCKTGCADLPENQRKSCTDGCFRGFEGCKARCLRSSFERSPRLATGEIVIAQCTQLPTRCDSNSDCKCSGCCAQLGEGGPKVCQPSCR